MPNQRPEQKPHLLVNETVTTQAYTRPRSGQGNNGFGLPPRNRQEHAQNLMAQLEAIQGQESGIVQEQKALGLNEGNGICIAFESSPEFQLKFQGLEFQRSGIELCSIKNDSEKDVATVFVPEGKLTHFLSRISAYRDEDINVENPDRPTKPKNKEFVESVSEIKLAALEALWTDEPQLFPVGTETIWWEVWLRKSSGPNYEGFLRDHADQLGVLVSTESLHFIDRTVLLVHATSEQITSSIQLLGSMAEVRKAKETADFFTEMGAWEQRKWMDDAVERLTALPEGCPRVCLLDTGVTNGHPFLRPIAHDNDMHTYRADWGTDDRYGHGTQMAGLSAYGDMTEVLASSDPIELTHCIESVKVTPRPGYHNDGRLFGAITSESVGRVEIEGNGPRVFCMAVTTTDGRDRGAPSSWSAAVDSIAHGGGENTRLFLISAGNTKNEYRHLYPDSNLTDDVHDPGQAWNALTVGAYTEKDQIDPTAYPGWVPVAPSGDISPSSCTSMDWSRVWPIKPDIVMEGGNMALSPVDGTADYIDDSLQLLSTDHRFNYGRLLGSFGDTSAAVALASRLAAQVKAAYPEYWAETIRALLVHSARWTPEMKARFLPLRTQDDYGRLLRYCGYGVPDPDILLWSAQNSLTLIAQDYLQPFFKDEDDGCPASITLSGRRQLGWPVLGCA